MWYIIVALILYPVIYVLIKKKRLGVGLYAVQNWNKLTYEQKDIIRKKLNKTNYWDATDDFMSSAFFFILAIVCLFWPLIPVVVIARWIFKKFYKFLDSVIKEKENF